MAKNSKELLEETEKLKIENQALQQQLMESKESLNAIKSGTIDALVITHEKELKVYTEKTADKPYRLLIEKMHEGAVTLNKDGSILYCNSSFAKMVNLPLQKITGTKIEKYMDDPFKGHFAEWLKSGGVSALIEEGTLKANEGKMIPALITVNALTLDELFVLSIIITDLTIQNENQERLKSRTKQLEEKNGQLENANKELAYQNEEKEKRAAELAIANKELAYQNEEKDKRAAELVIANKELAYQNEEKDKRAIELSIADKELEFQSGEKEKRAAELSIADKELEFQSGEKEKRAAELIVANKELEFQSGEKDKRAAELAIANKELAYQNEEKDKRAAELVIANKELAYQNEEKDKRAAELSIADKELEFQSGEKEKRAAELSIADKELEFQSGEKEKRAAELIVANKELEFQSSEKEKRAAELSIADKELEFQSGEKEKRAAELIVANKELEFQSKEKEKRAAELIVANKELEYQNKEKDKRAAELIVANKELEFQNEEKDKRAAELVIANKELAYQNKEKEKRATELAIANKELSFQNEEKDKRATELVIANKELAYQNEEKEKRATELVIANKELAYQNEEKDKRAAELIIVETDVKELVGLNTHKERILSTIAHDLRSPLAGIIQTVDLLKEDFETMKAIELKGRLDMVYNLSIDELSMLDSLVDWARIKFASEAFSPANIELGKYVKKVFATFNEIAFAKGIHLSYEIEENIIVFADKKMLLSILQNIVSNSIKNTQAEGRITALAKRIEDIITVEIRDTGIGMSKEVKEKLFEPQMEDLSKARKEKKGAGIGLLLIKGFVNKNGGEISVESIEGKGTSFYFTLPAEKQLD